MGAFPSDIVLGEKYRDDQTEIEGIATAVYFYQHACERVNIELVVKGEVKEYTFDAPRLTHIRSGRRVKVDKTGGPERGGARSTPTR